MLSIPDRPQCLCLAANLPGFLTFDLPGKTFYLHSLTGAVCLTCGETPITPRFVSVYWCVRSQNDQECTQRVFCEKYIPIFRVPNRLFHTHMIPSFRCSTISTESLTHWYVGHLPIRYSIWWKNKFCMQSRIMLFTNEYNLKKLSKYF